MVRSRSLWVFKNFTTLAHPIQKCSLQSCNLTISPFFELVIGYNKGTRQVYGSVY